MSDTRQAEPHARKADGLRRALPLGQRDEALVSDTKEGGNPPAGEPRRAAGKSQGGAPSEPGRALAVTDFSPPDISPGERLVRLAYRFGIPGSALRRPFGKPLSPKLLATAESPLAGSRPAGMALRAGHFLVHGVKAPIAQIDFAPGARLTPPFERMVHGFDWLRDIASCAAREQVVTTAERILQSWLRDNEKPGTGAAWRVELAGRRLLNSLIHAPVLLSTQNKPLRARALHNLSDTARWLDRNVTRGKDRLAEVQGWAAIVAAGLLLPDGKPRRLFGEAGLMRALGELVSEDGGVLSRSPRAQMEALRILIDCRACYAAVQTDHPAQLDEVLAMLVPPLLNLTHADGSLGSWQGSEAVSAAEVRALVEASGVRARPLRQPRGWGYQRVASAGSVLQFDAAPPPLTRHCRNGCASTLAFEFSHGSQRLIVNCGGAYAAGGQIPVRIEQGLRASAAHSTLVLDNANSTAVEIGGSLGSGVTEVEVDRRTVDTRSGTATRLEASHDGYVSRYGLVHRRILMMRDDGTELRGEDVLVPSGNRGKRGKVGYAIRFHMGPQIDLRLSRDKRGALLTLPDGTAWQLRVNEGELAIEESLWADGEGKPHPIEQLVLGGMVSRGGGSFAWLLRKTA